MTKKRWFWILLSVGAILVLTVSQTFAKAGSGGEPGGGCADLPEGTWKYADPPFTGKLLATLRSDGTIEISGTLEQSGNSGCFLVILPAPYSGDLFTLAEFQAIKPIDIKGECVIISVPSSACFDFSDDIFIEIVSAGAIKYINDGHSFDFNVTIKRLVLQLPK
jgi:hypothetical protein